MLIELRKGMTLHPGTFNVVIAPEKVMVSALNNNLDLQRFLFLFVRGNYSLLHSSISRSSKNFEVRRAFTALQLFTILKEVSRTVVLLEHDPTLFEGRDNMIPQIAGMLIDISRESFVILYTPSIDRQFSVLMRCLGEILPIQNSLQKKLSIIVPGSGSESRVPRHSPFPGYFPDKTAIFCSAEILSKTDGADDRKI